MGKPVWYKLVAAHSRFRSPWWWLSRNSISTTTLKKAELCKNKCIQLFYKPSWTGLNMFELQKQSRPSFPGYWNTQQHIIVQKSSKISLKWVKYVPTSMTTTSPSTLSMSFHWRVLACSINSLSSFTCSVHCKSQVLKYISCFQHFRSSKSSLVWCFFICLKRWVIHFKNTYISTPSFAA